MIRLMIMIPKMITTSVAIQPIVLACSMFEAPSIKTELNTKITREIIATARQSLSVGTNAD
jgi:hypothetical protein